MFQNKIRDQEALVPVLPLPVGTEQASGPCFLSYKVGLWDRPMGSDALLIPTIHRGLQCAGHCVKGFTCITCIIRIATPYSLLQSSFYC